METPFYQVDVFTNHIFGGNPLAVFTKGQDLKEEYLQKVAREMNLSETTFVFPSTKDEADFDVRIFTPTLEIPFAGHPTLGTAYVLRKNGWVTRDKNPIRLNFKAGIIPVWAEKDKDFMQHPAAKTLYELDRSEKIAKALGAIPKPFRQYPACSSGFYGVSRIIGTGEFLACHAGDNLKSPNFT